MNGLSQSCSTSYSSSPSYGGDATAAPCGPIEGRVREIQAEQQRTHGLIDDLEQRLGLALAHKAEAKVGGPLAVRGGDSPLHSTLGEVLDHAEGINARLRLLLNRITL